MNSKVSVPLLIIISSSTYEKYSQKYATVRAAYAQARPTGSRKPQHLTYVYIHHAETYIQNRTRDTTPHDMYIPNTDREFTGNLRLKAFLNARWAQTHVEIMGGGFFFTCEMNVLDSGHSQPWSECRGSKKNEVWFSCGGEENHAQRKVWLRINPIRTRPNQQPRGN